MSKKWDAWNKRKARFDREASPELRALHELAHYLIKPPPPLAESMLADGLIETRPNAGFGDDFLYLAPRGTAILREAESRYGIGVVEGG